MPHASPDVAQNSPDAEASPFHGGGSVESKLDRARLSLLDLSARNRLLNAPQGAKGKRSIEIVDERSVEVYRLLVKEEQAFTFVAGRSSAAASAEEGDADEIADLAQPEDDSVDERGVFRRHADTRLQTRLTSKGLQKRLLEMYTDAILLEQEQGVNILFLAQGMLKWVDPKDKKLIRYAPLLLIPVSLGRTSAADRFRLKWRHEEVASNLSLEAFLDREHRLKMPTFEFGEDLDLPSYFNQIAETVAQKEGWEVLPDAQTLGFFSFAKFLMYRDLGNECWPEDGKLAQQPLIRSLLADGFEPLPLTIPEDAFVDDYIPVADMLHVADADSSQMKAIYEARQGRSLIIQGPPGTGKSQTIANIIATAVADGKTVLFVAEKMVALTVVKSRLDRLGVGDACLELHSHNANKRAVLQELRRTWELGVPQAVVPPSLNSTLQGTREQMNAHAAGMNRRHPVAELTPFQVVGELAHLARQGRTPVDFTLEAAELWTPDDVEARQNLLTELAQRIADMGSPRSHPWRGVRAAQMMPTDTVGDRLIPAAWDTDLSGARLALAAHGTGLMRYFSGEWKSANRLVGSMLQDGKTPLPQVLSLLDKLAKGQSARRRLLEERDFGREAFGSLWRDDRSSATELAAVVGWLKGLGSLREEVRLIASHTREQSAVAREHATLERLEKEVSAALGQLEPGLLTQSNDLAELAHQADVLIAAERKTEGLFVVKPKDLGARTELLRALHALQQVTLELEAGRDRGEALFATSWNGVRSDWATLRQAAAWMEANADLRQVAAGRADTEEPLSRARQLLTERTAVHESWIALLASVNTGENDLEMSEPSPESLRNDSICGARLRNDCRSGRPIATASSGPAPVVCSLLPNAWQTRGWNRTKPGLSTPWRTTKACCGRCSTTIRSWRNSTATSTRR